MSEVQNKFITADVLYWQGKVYKAQPEPTVGNRCTGCAFRTGGACGKPLELRDYICIGTIRSDLRGIIWVEED